VPRSSKRSNLTFTPVSHTHLTPVCRIIPLNHDGHLDDAGVGTTMPSLLSADDDWRDCPSESFVRVRLLSHSSAITVRSSGTSADSSRFAI
jgi:hypothetical protein